MKIKDTIKKREDIFIKYVKRARMWCKTYWDDQGFQKQEWTIDKPIELIKFN